MFFALLFLLFSVFCFNQFYWKRRRLPPGPMPWPLIGNIATMDQLKLDEQLLAYKRVYGDVFTLWLPNAHVVFSDAQALKETFVKQGDAFAGRPVFNMMKIWLNGNYGLTFSNNVFWRSQRRFALRILRNFGFGKPILEDTIIHQAQIMTDVLKQQNDTPYDVAQLVTTAVGNVVFQLTFGTTIDIEDDLLNRMRMEMLEAFELFNHPMGFLIELWMGFKFLDPLFGGVYKRSKKMNDDLVVFLQKQIAEHRRTIDFGGEPHDYVDAFLMEQRKQLLSDGTVPDEWNDLQLIGSLYDLLSAGMETTSTTIRTFLLFMLHCPEVQAKVHAEIDTIVGRDRVITMADQSRLPYLAATIQELQRIAVILSMNLPHELLEDISYKGYRLPKGTTVIAQFPSVHMDKVTFPNPWRFDPSRHLDRDGCFQKDDRITPFSLGKRACLGEALARMELFLFIATLLQRFQFLPEEPGNPPKISFCNGFVKSPAAFRLRPRFRD